MLPWEEVAAVICVIHEVATEDTHEEVQECGKLTSVGDNELCDAWVDMSQRAPHGCVTMKLPHRPQALEIARSSRRNQTSVCT